MVGFVPISGRENRSHPAPRKRQRRSCGNAAIENNRDFRLQMRLPRAQPPHEALLVILLVEMDAWNEPLANEIVTIDEIFHAGLCFQMVFEDALGREIIELKIPLGCVDQRLLGDEPH